MKVRDLIRDDTFRRMTRQGYALTQIYRECPACRDIHESSARRAWRTLRAEFGMPPASTSRTPKIDLAAEAPPLPPEPEPEPPRDHLAEARERSRTIRAHRDAATALRDAIARIEELEAELQVARALDVGAHPITVAAAPPRSTDDHEATAIMLWSDWHVGEIVSRDSVNGVNEYSPEIARASVEALARNCVKLLHKERQDVPITSAVIWLGGDFMTGYIHEENLVTTAMGPTEEVVFAGSLLSGAIRHVLDHGDLSRLVLPCSLGNHGRTTKRMFTLGAGTNHEAAMYRFLAREFENDDRVEFMQPVSDHLYVDVYHKRIRFHHGHDVKYNGGENGLGVPLAKKVRKWNEILRADMTAIGHYHTHSMPTNDSWTNGSLIGFNPYAQKIGARPEPPVQGFRLLDSKYGWTISAPVIVRGGV